MNGDSIKKMSLKDQRYYFNDSKNWPAISLNMSPHRFQEIILSAHPDSTMQILKLCYPNFIDKPPSKDKATIIWILSQSPSKGVKKFLKKFVANHRNVQTLSKKNVYQYVKGTNSYGRNRARSGETPPGYFPNKSQPLCLAMFQSYLMRERYEAAKSLSSLIRNLSLNDLTFFDDYGRGDELLNKQNPSECDVFLNAYICLATLAVNIEKNKPAPNTYFNRFFHSSTQRKANEQYNAASEMYNNLKKLLEKFDNPSEDFPTIYKTYHDEWAFIIDQAQLSFGKLKALRDLSWIPWCVLQCLGYKKTDSLQPDEGASMLNIIKKTGLYLKTTLNEYTYTPQKAP